MKKAIVIFLAIFACMGVSAQTGNDSVKPQDMNTQIRDELQTIRKIQEENKKNSDSIKKQLQIEKDSTKIPLNEYGAMLTIADNTTEEPWTDDWNFYGWVAFGVALGALVFGVLTYFSQRKTAKHTENAPISAQIGVMKDLPRHFYRNLACTCAALLKFRDKSNISNGVRRKYPSEANIRKLATLPEEFILPIDIPDSGLYQKMHECRVLFRNYNMETDVASTHFAIRRLPDDSLKNDYDNLLFKPFYLTSRMFELKALFPVKSLKEEKIDNNLPYTIYAFVKEHLEKVNYRKLLENRNGEQTMLAAIASDDAFNSAVGVFPDSIERGLNRILGYNIENERDWEDAFDFLHRVKTTDADGKETLKCEIDKHLFVNYFNEHYTIEERGKTKGVNRLAYLADNKTDKGQRDWRNEPDASLAGVMKPYFYFFLKDRWDAKELIFHILRIDTVLETSIIGMIDYE